MGKLVKLDTEDMPVTNDQPRLMGNITLTYDDGKPCIEWPDLYENLSDLIGQGRPFTITYRPT